MVGRVKKNVRYFLRLCHQNTKTQYLLTFINQESLTNGHSYFSPLLAIFIWQRNLI